jgi:hypothetical protein
MAKHTKPPRTAAKTRRPPWRLLALAAAMLTAIAAVAFWLNARSLHGRQPATAAAIKELLVATAPRTALSAAAADSMIEQLRATPGAVDPKVVTLIPAEVDAYFAEAMTRPGGLGEVLVPVFAQRFTAAEVEQLLVFYRSPLGRKLADEMPLIAAQSATLSQQWVMEHWPELSQRVEAALAREGIRLPPKTMPLPEAITGKP